MSNAKRKSAVRRKSERPKVRATIEERETICVTNLGRKGHFGRNQ
jgi:hypothetical protein